MQLTFKQAEKLDKAYKLIYSAYDALESLRPGGGFKDYVKEGECKECGAKIENEKQKGRNGTSASV